MRYIDVGIASRRSDGGEDGRSGEATGTCLTTAAQGQFPGESGQVGRSLAADRVSRAWRSVGTRHRRSARNEQGRPSLADDGRASGRTAPTAAGRTDRQRIWHRSMDTQTGAPADRIALRRPIQRLPCLAHPGCHGLVQPEAGKARHRARRGRRADLEAQNLARAHEWARRAGRVIVFIDESGLSERPARVGTGPVPV